MRLIDADELKQQFVDKLVRVGLSPEKAEEFAKTAFDAIFKTIDAMPTIEAVPLEDYRSMEQTVYKLTQALAEAEPTKHYNTESYKMTVTDFPPVEYAPIKHGRWIEDEYGFLVCSECGNTAEYLPILGQIETPYCSECGARMDEVTE